MNRRVVFLNCVLLALAGWLSWMLRVEWAELHRHESTVLALAPEVRNRLIIPPPMPLMKPMSAADYNDVAQKMLFAKDRNPNVIVDPPPAPPPPPPPPKMPDLPSYYGIMSFGDPVVLLRLPKGVQKKYHAGDEVGPFQLVSFSRDKIVFDWNGEKVERKPEELKEVEAAPETPAAAVPTPAASAPNVKSISAAAANEPKVSEKIGKDDGGGVRTCVAGDDSPPGTVIDGYKKVVTTNMFGPTCMWQQVNP